MFNSLSGVKFVLHVTTFKYSVHKFSETMLHKKNNSPFTLHDHVHVFLYTTDYCTRKLATVAVVDFLVWEVCSENCIDNRPVRQPCEGHWWHFKPWQLAAPAQWPYFGSFGIGILTALAAFSSTSRQKPPFCTWICVLSPAYPVGLYWPHLSCKQVSYYRHAKTNPL